MGPRYCWRVSRALGRRACLSGCAGRRASAALRWRSLAGRSWRSQYAWGVVRQLLEPRLRGMSAAARRPTLAGAAALAGPVVLADSAANPEASFGVLHGLYWLVAALAEQRPQLLVIDDLQWSDDASARFWGSSRTGSTRFPRCCWRRSGRAARSGRRPWSGRSGSRRCRRLQLPRCSASATVARCLRRLWRRATAPPAAIRC